MVWLKVGRLQKLLLFLLLEEDTRQGRRIPVWRVVQRKFKIEYSEFGSKKHQKAFEAERKIRRAYDRLVVRGCVVSLWSAKAGFSLFSLDGSVCDFCILTQKGRLLAERLKYQEYVLKDEEAVRRVLGRVGTFDDNDDGFVTFEYVLELLWEDAFHGFVDRDAFDSYWNNTKLGKLLLKYGVSSRSRISNRDNRRLYEVTSNKNNTADNDVGVV